MVAGPLAGQMLADLGAEVIKIEPVGGDPLRRVGPAHKGMTAMFLANNRHKKSIELDLKTPEGQDIARRIAATADVFIENSRPGVMARLNLSYEDLRTVNPRLVYASVSGFGQTGPYVSRPAFDQVIQAVSGVMEIQGAGGEPQPLNTVLVDKYAAAATASAITAALLHRERTGEGQFVSVSLLDSFASLALVDAIRNQTFKQLENPVPRVNINRPIRTADGMLFGHVQTHDQAARVCRIFDREDLLEDPRFSTDRARTLNVRDLWGELEKVSQDLPTKDIMEKVVAAGAPLAAVNKVTDLLTDPQAMHNHTVVEFTDEEFGPIRVVNYPARFEKSPARVEARSPKLGEHTEEILRGLGLSTQHRGASGSTQN
jgi:CoA:oxalate CoA-transferase